LTKRVPPFYKGARGGEHWAFGTIILLNNHIASPCSKVKLGWKVDKNPAMRTYKQIWGDVVLLALVVSLFSGCQLTPYIRDVHEDGHLIVQLEDHTGGPFPENPMPFDHPVELSEDQWGQILRAIQIQREPGGDPAYGIEKVAEEAKQNMESLFIEHEVHSLQKYIAQAFARARSSEWITFVLRHPLGSYEWFNKTITAQSMTSGGFYVANHRLHLYLTNIRVPITSTAMADHIWDNPFYTTDATYYQVKDTATQTVQKHPQEGLRGKVNPSINEVILELAPLLEGQKWERQDQPGNGKLPAIHSRPDPELTQTLRDLLILQQEGLITQKDYDDMKRTLLKKFMDESHKGQ